MALLIGVVVLVGAIESPAQARKKRVRTSLAGTSANVEGTTVESVFGTLQTKRPCLEDRTVTVEYASVKGGAYATYGSDQTDAEGVWVTTGPPVPDTSHFTISVAKKNAGKLVCLGEKSEGYFRS